MGSIDIWRVADGFVVEHWDEDNVLDMLRQIGFVGFLKAGLTWPAQRARSPRTVIATISGDSAGRTGEYDGSPRTASRRTDIG